MLPALYSVSSASKVPVKPLESELVEPYRSVEQKNSWNAEVKMLLLTEKKLEK